MGEFLNEYRRLTLVSAALCGALMLNELALPEIARPHPIETIQLGPEDRHTIIPDGPCAITNPGNPGLPASVADACAATFDDMKIAFVNYDLSSEAVNAYVPGVTAGLKSITHGLLHPDIQIISASDKTKQAMAKVIGKDSQGRPCVNADNAEDFVSEQAYENMPELDTFNYIVGISSMDNCKHTLDGINSDGRYIDLFDSPSYGETQDNKDDDMIHELLHGVDLGHAGSVTVSGVTETNWFDRGILDVAHFFDNNYTYLEYGENGEQMGRYSQSPTKAVLNPIHQNELRWPFITKGTATSKEHALTVTSPQTISANDASQENFITLPLDTPITLTTGGSKGQGKQGDDKTRTFNQLAIAPVVAANTQKPAIQTANIYLVGPGNITALFDTYSIDRQTLFLKLAHATAQVSISPQALQVRLAKN